MRREKYDGGAEFLGRASCRSICFIFPRQDFTFADTHRDLEELFKLFHADLRPVFGADLFPLPRAMARLYLPVMTARFDFWWTEDVDSVLQMLKNGDSDPAEMPQVGRAGSDLELDFVCPSCLSTFVWWVVSFRSCPRQNKEGRGG